MRTQLRSIIHWRHDDRGSNMRHFRRIRNHPSVRSAGSSLQVTSELLPGELGFRLRLSSLHWGEEVTRLFPLAATRSGQ